MKCYPYLLAVVVAQRVGWRNVTQRLMFAEAVANGLANPDADPAAWARSHLRGANRINLIRDRLAAEGYPEGERIGGRHQGWQHENRKRVLRAACELMCERGTIMVPRQDIAKRAGVSHSGPSKIFGSVPALRHAMWTYARLFCWTRLAAQGEALGYGHGRSSGPTCTDQNR